MKYRVTTESGSLYYIDTEKKTMIRYRGEWTDELQGDGDVLPYSSISPIDIGEPVQALWFRSPEHLYPTLRVTSLVEDVEEIV